MTNWFDKFKNIADVKVHLAKLKLFDKLHIHIGKKETTIINNRTIIVNSSKNKTDLEKIIPEAIEEGYPLLQENSAKLLEEAKKTSALPQNVDLLNFYQDKIPLLDQIILRASMHIEQLYKKKDKNHAEQVKLGLIQNYGQRGRNICRLYCASYFAGFIKTVYEKMSALHGFKKAHFEGFYELVVTESPYAIFIEKVMDQNKVKEIIQQRINSNKKYRISFNIHGIGKENCLKIRESVSELEDDGIIKISPDIIEKHKVITVTLRFE